MMNLHIPLLFHMILAGLLLLGAGRFICRRGKGMITTEWIRGLMDKHELWRFYKTPEWIQLKTQVLMDNHYECRICRSKGIVTRYDEGEDGTRRRLSTVHHVKEVRKHPELALERYYYDRAGNRHENLIPVCKACHNALHNRTFDGRARAGKKFTTPERW